MFFLMFPDAPQQMSQRFTQQPIQQMQQQQQMQPPAPCVNRLREVKPLTADDVPLPIDKNSPPTHLEIRGADEIQKTEEQLRQELQQQAQTAFEQRLVSILVKINVAACTTCNRDDKMIILQLKMMKALLDGKPKDALKFSTELNKYLSTKVDQLPKPKPTPKDGDFLESRIR
jgi:hypothetical protein